MNLVPRLTRCDDHHTAPEYPLTTHPINTIDAQYLAEDVGKTDVDAPQHYICALTTVMNTNPLIESTIK